MNVPARYDDSEWKYVPKAVRGAVEDMKISRRGIYLHGEVGTGKTYILWAIAKYLSETRNHHAIVWNTSELFHQIRTDFDREPNERINPLDEMAPEHKRLVMLDDIGVEKPTDFVIETIYRTVNIRYEAEMPMIFASNLSIGDLAEQIGERTVSRIVEMCDTIKLNGQDRRVK